MAGEIQVTTKLYAAKTGAQTGNVTHNWTGNMSRDPDVLTQTQAIGTTEESMDIGPDITAPYIVEIANIDSTNYVEVGVATGVYFARILAGQTLFIPYVATGVTIYLKANTAAVSVVTTAAEL